jgi:hypothetical protein
MTTVAEEHSLLDVDPHAGVVVVVEHAEDIALIPRPCFDLQVRLYKLKV